MFPLILTVLNRYDNRGYYKLVLLVGFLLFGENFGGFMCQGIGGGLELTELRQHGPGVPRAGELASWASFRTHSQPYSTSSKANVF